MKNDIFRKYQTGPYPT